MDLQNFEERIDEKIIDRGYVYYLEDLVTLISVNGFDYRYQVSGSELYKVTVTLGEETEIISSFCDCPYTYGPVCKHEVAVYFELFDLMDDESGEMIIPVEAQSDLTAVLNELPKDELIRIIEEFTYEDLIVKNRLLLQYSTKTAGQEVESFKSLMRAIVSKYLGREGFIGYRETSDFADELGDCLLKIENSEDPLLAMDLSFLLLEESIEAFQYADDSSGDIGDLVEGTLEMIDVKVAEAIESAYDQQQALFEKLLQQCERPIFEGWEEFRDTLLSIATYFAGDEENRKMLTRKIESLIEEGATDYTRRYHNERMSHLLFKIIEEYGTEEEAERFIQDHLDYSSFREQLIQRYITAEKYEQVIQLATDGERKDAEFRGLVSKWQQYRYAAYKGLSRHEEQKALAKELFMAGDFAYYQELKELAENPAQYYVQLKEELQRQSGWQAKSLFRSLIEEEHDVTELLAFVQANPQLIEQYADDLIKLYPEEIQAIYYAYIISKSAGALNRGAYQEVCRTIRRYAKIVGKQHQQSIVDELRKNYRRKPAFMDELSRV